MCGVVGIVGTGPVNQQIYDALTVVQHRGQDAAGIMTCDGRRVFLRKDSGLVRDVFQARHMLQLDGNMGLGHVRYPTAGGDNRSEAQPFYVNSPFGLALGHNGNLVNAPELSEELFQDDLRQINTGSDSEVLLNVFAHELMEFVRGGDAVLQTQNVFDAVRRLHERCQGAYAVVVMIVGYGLVAFRDPYGIRPLVLGERVDAQGRSLMAASESVALDVLGYQHLGDIAPGEAVAGTHGLRGRSPGGRRDAGPLAEVVGPGGRGPHAGGDRAQPGARVRQHQCRQSPSLSAGTQCRSPPEHCEASAR